MNKNTDTKFNSILDVLKNFPDEKSCREYLERLRWNDGKIVCQKCGSNDKIYKIRDGKLYKCAKCSKQFTVRLGTIFEDSALPLQTWFMALFLITAHKKGISSLQLSRDLSITQKSAWFVLHRIRYAVKTKSFNKPLEGVIQCDETYVGGRAQNRHQSRWAKRTSDTDLSHYKRPTAGRSTLTKAPVLGMVSDSGEVVGYCIPDVTGKTIKPLIQKHVKEGSTIVTDEFRVYPAITKEYLHKTVSHRLGEYVNNGFHTNTVEGFWSWLKRSIFGIYHQVSKEHLQAYVDECAYKYNTRKITDVERFNKTLSALDGKLTYKQLTKKSL